MFKFSNSDQNGISELVGEKWGKRTMSQFIETNENGTALKHWSCPGRVAEGVEEPIVEIF